MRAVAEDKARLVGKVHGWMQAREQARIDAAGVESLQRDLRELRDHIERAGWTKQDVAGFLYERARIRRAEWADVGKGAVVRDRGERIHSALESPDHLLVVAAGGPAGGFGAVIPPWMGSRTKAVTAAIGACVDCEPPKE